MNSWENARTLADLGGLTALFLEGKGDHPLWNGGIDEETSGLVPFLSRYNRRGFITTLSQPGSPETNEYRQRAFVEGFATMEVVLSIYRLCLCTDLIVMLSGPKQYTDFQIPVTANLHTVSGVSGSCGASYKIDELMDYVEYEPLKGELGKVWSIAVIDPCWGRNDYLWPMLGTVLIGLE